MNSLLVPTLGLDLSLLTRLAASLDHPIKRKVIINNGRRGALDEWRKEHRDWTVFDNPENLGVAGSWNLCPLFFGDEDAWLICNDDVWFNPGYLKRLCDCADANAKTEPIIFTNNTHGYYTFIWTKCGVERFGTFDENLFPAYYEDSDMNLRHRLGGKIRFCYACNDLPPMNHGKPKCGGIEYNAVLQAVGLFNRRYWERKWGNSKTLEQPEWRLPFRDKPLNHWTLDTERRKVMQAVWSQFINQPSPSLYD